MTSFAIVMPTHNDNDSTKVLVEKLVGLKPEESFPIVVVDDSSEIPVSEIQFISGNHVHVIRLEENVGHQVAISKGIHFALTQFPNLKWLVVMDSDGEDAPDDALMLIEQAMQADRTVVALRGKRFVSNGFRFGYFLYRALFRVLTGYSMNFGNFGAYKVSDLRRVISRGYISTHLPASLIESSIVFSGIKVDRHPRFFGFSKMSTKALMIHGLAGVSVLWASIVRRSLILAVLMSLVLIVGILMALLLFAFGSSWLVPGWTSTMLALGAILITQVWSSWIILVLVLYRVKPSDRTKESIHGTVS